MVLEDFITGSYKDIEGVFETGDSGYLVVDKDIFEQTASNGVDIDALEEKYGDEIARRHERRQKELSKQNKRVQAKCNLEKANLTRSMQKERLQALVLQLVLQGCRKVDIAEALDISVSTAGRAVNGLTEDVVVRLFTKYRETIFRNLTIDSFLACGCDYKRHLKVCNQVGVSSDSAFGFEMEF